MSKSLCSLSCQQSSYFELLHGLPSYKGALWEPVRAINWRCSTGVLNGHTNLRSCTILHSLWMYPTCDQPSSWADDVRSNWQGWMGARSSSLVHVILSYQALKRPKIEREPLHQNFPANAIGPTTDTVDNKFGWWYAYRYHARLQEWTLQIRPNTTEHYRSKTE